jgi:RNA polymerase subunit RPABC4/transcription elongation factor Spt4
MDKFWYKYKHQRGFSIGCQPKGFIDYDGRIAEYGGIAYDRELTVKEIEDYELIPMFKENVCPICKMNDLLEEGANALSRKDNKTEICSECGVAEAMEELEKMLEEG